MACPLPTFRNVSDFSVDPSELMRVGTALTSFRPLAPTEALPGNFIDPELVDALTGIGTRTFDHVLEGNDLVVALGSGLHAAARRYKIVDGWPE